MRVPRRTNFLWGLLVLAVAVLILLQSLNSIPSGIADLLGRAWPALLVIAGLSIFLRDRLRIGGLVALLVGVGLVGAMTAVSFSNRSAQPRDDYQQTLAEPVGDAITLLRVQLRLLDTDVEIVRTLQGRSVLGQFIGSRESLVNIQYAEAGDGTASLTVDETRPNAFPLLDAVGRGSFRLELPADVPLDVSFEGLNGALILNLSGLALERLNFDLHQGSAIVSLPEYRPLNPRSQDGQGVFVVRDGNITVRVPQSVAARLTLNRGGSGLQPVYDALIYNYLANDILEARSFDAAEIQLRYGVTAPRGTITLEVASS
ncbi:MAG: hypothetical protein JNM70_16475 [Anaerolineae bacterium]|nr:hypothetical protein [Anaerolineae bacterium]